MGSLGGLTSLFVIDNEIADLAPIAGLTRLEDLHLGGNRVETLDVLRNFPRLRNLTLANGDPAQLADGVVVRPFRFFDNPIDDARALDEVPLLRNVLTAADRLRVTAVTYPDLAPHSAGTAVRRGDSNRFDLTPDAGGQPARWILATLLHSPEAGADAVLVCCYLPGAQTAALAVADPEDRSATLPIAETKARLDAEPMIGFALALLVGVEPTPDLRGDGGRLSPCSSPVQAVPARTSRTSSTVQVTRVHARSVRPSAPTRYSSTPCWLTSVPAYPTLRSKCSRSTACPVGARNSRTVSENGMPRAAPYAASRSAVS